MDEGSSNGAVVGRKKRKRRKVASTRVASARPTIFIDYGACSSHNSNVPNGISNEHILDVPSRVLPLVAKAEELEQAGRVRIVRCKRPASEEEILRCATPEYIQYAKTRCQSKRTPYLDYDETTLANSDSLYWAYRAAGCTIDAARAVYDSKDEPNTSRGFVLVRPPGHHNSCSANLEELFEVTDEANHVWGCNGGCLFNNIACAVRALKAEDRSNGMRICIVDLDAHFGDGTAIQFFGEDDVFTVSLHQNQTNLFPFLTGSVEENCNSLLNIPLNEATGDKQVLEALEKMRVVQKIRAFEPKFMFVACGFDALESDKSSSLEFTPRLYGQLIRMLLPLCDKLLCVLEGGYSSSSVDAFEEVMKALSEDS